MAQGSIPQDIINRCLLAAEVIINRCLPVSEERVPQDIIDGCLRAGQAGNIAALYELIGNHPHVLEQIDNTPFAETPLHAAASAGKIEFALEIMTLRPSLSRKLNRDGFTPLHLVLSQLQTPEHPALRQTQRNGHQHPQSLLKQLISFVRRPPLEFAQRTMDQWALSYREAQHEPNPLRSNFVLCLLQFDKDLARVKGKGGQTPLHYAAQIGDLQLLEEILTICPMSVLDVTVKSETTLHVALKNYQFKAYILLKEWLRDASFEDASLWRKKLKNWKDANNETFSDLASRHKRDIREIEEQSYLPIVLQAWKNFESYTQVKEETRSAVLVVFVLLLTLIFQMTTTPPGGTWQDDGSSHRAGTAVMGRGPFIAFTVINSVSLLLSIGAIILLLPPAPISKVCTASICFLVAYFIMSVCVTFPSPNALPLKAFYIAFLVPFLYFLMGVYGNMYD